MHQTESYYSRKHGTCWRDSNMILSYTCQYPLDFGADVTHDSCLMAANFRSLAACFDKKMSTKTSDQSLFKKRYLTNYKKVAKIYDRTPGCRIRLFQSGPTVYLIALTWPRNILRHRLICCLAHRCWKPFKNLFLQNLEKFEAESLYRASGMGDYQFCTKGNPGYTIR